MANDYTHLAWIDLESTGTDELSDPILEIGFILTDRELHVIEEKQAVISPAYSFDGWQDWMSQVVVEMHSHNGLLEDVARWGRRLIAVEAELISYMAEVGAVPHRVRLAGSGVSHFDRRFIKAQMPLLYKWFDYKNMDTGVVREFIRAAGREDLIPTLNNDKTHRAMDDIRLHLEEGRYYRALFQGIPGHYAMPERSPLDYDGISSIEIVEGM